MDCIVSITKAWRSPLATTRRTEMLMLFYVELAFVDGRELKKKEKKERWMIQLL